MRNIIVQVADYKWTLQAVHLAAALARNNHAQVTLLHLVLAQNPGLLGAGMAIPIPTPQEHHHFEMYIGICEDYDVPCTLQPMQYVTRVGALKEAISCLEADALFTKSPHHSLQWWQKLHTWWVKRSLQSTSCTLYLVDENTSTVQNYTHPPMHRQEPEEANILHHA